MSSRSSTCSGSRGDHEDNGTACDYFGDGIEAEDNSNDERSYPTSDAYYDGHIKRRHRKALDIKNNGLSTDGLQVMLDRYATNVRFIELVQTGMAPNRLLVSEMRGQTASQIYTRCSKRDSFTETHVGDDVMATFSTIRDYRAACDTERMDPDRFRRVFHQFANWDEPQYEEFKRNYTLEYVFRRILQRDSRYRTRYTRLLQQCQESTDYSTIDRPLLPLPTPKFLTGDSQLELCNSSLRSKLRNMRKRGSHGSAESSPDSEAFLARLDEAVCSFFRQLDFVEESSWALDSSRSVAPVRNNTKLAAESREGTSRKRPSATLLSFRSLMGGDRKRPATMVGRAAVQTNTLARAVLRKAFRASARSQPSNTAATKASEDVVTSSCPKPVERSSGGGESTNGFQTPKDDSPTSYADTESNHSDDQQQQQRSLLLANRGASANITKRASSSRVSINSISMMMMLEKTRGAKAAVHHSTDITNSNNQLDAGDSVLSASSDGYARVDSLPVADGVSLLGVGADEPIDEEDLRSILGDLAGMHAVITCEDFGRIIEHGSVQHPEWGTILVRRGRVVRLGCAQSGFQAPDQLIEFHFPMEQLADFVPPEKIRFDDERNLYLSGKLTDFYFLQA